jgi:hypothetical protein
MNRRDFLKSATVVSAGLAFSKAEYVFAKDASTGTWRTFDVTTHVDVLKPSGITRIWVPAALISATPFQKTLSNTFEAPGGTAKLVKIKAESLGIISAEFPAGVKPSLTVTSRIATQNIAVISPRPPRGTRRTTPSWSIFCNRRISCPPTAS